MFFNDKHVEGKNLNHLMMDLSFLGEQLALRLELEDELIQHYFQLTSLPSV